MVSEILIRDALKALSIPVNEATVHNSRKVAAQEVAKLSEHYHRLVTDEFILHALNPHLDAPSLQTVELVAQAQAKLTYQDILKLITSPEAALDIQYSRAQHLHARKRVYPFLEKHPTSTEVEGAFLLARGTIPPAGALQDPLEELDAEADLDPTPFMKHLIPQLIRLTALRHGDTLPESVLETYQWVFTCSAQQQEEKANEVFWKTQSSGASFDEDVHHQNLIFDKLREAAEIHLWKTTQEKLLQYQELQLESPLNIFFCTPQAPRNHVAGTLILASPDNQHPDFLHAAQNLYTAVASTPKKLNPIPKNSPEQPHPPQDQAPHTMSGASKGYTRAEIHTIHDTNSSFLPELFMEKFLKPGGQVPTPPEFRLTYNQAHQRCMLQQREFHQADQEFLNDYDEDLKEEYLQQVDAAIRDMYGDDFFESSTPEEIQTARAAVMDTVPLEDFQP